MQPPWLGSDSGIENRRNSGNMRSLEECGCRMDQFSEGNGVHFLKSPVFRNTLLTIQNECNSDQIGQLFDCIESQKTESSITTSIWSQESILNISAFGSIDKSCERSRKDQLNSRFSEQIRQFW
ncbi:MAG: hypothetical protein EZS28_028143 [Streblomastix strix]|uniref:Uncharacterized protein n=1 Tax=Streblomastix strix TaxID=222440 RepID=A0A5J4V2M3_9EUKA|nr:MAG: hypothetical protein EZS28_028143 [Streblomastix strix]